MVFQRIYLLLVCFLSQEVYAFHLFHYDFPPLKESTGTVEMTVIDSERMDPHSEGKLQRELPIRVWYPGIDIPKQDFSYWGYAKRELILREFSLETGFPKFLVEPVNQGEIRSKENLPIVPGKYPVVILLHGLMGAIEESTDLAEFLASKGFFVIGIEFPYGSMISKISQMSEPIRTSKKLIEILTRYPVSKPELIAYRKEEHKIWVEDVRFVLHTLQSRKNEMFSHLDWKNMSMIGHSHGGMVALDACLKEATCQSSVNMDGWTYELEFPADLKKHLLLTTLSSGEYFNSFCSNKVNCSSKKITECDIGHEGFSDKIYIKWPFSHFTHNQCGSKSVEIKQLIHKKIEEFIRK